MAYLSRVLLDDEDIERRPYLSRMAIFGAPFVEFVVISATWAAARAVLSPYIVPADPELAQLVSIAFLAGFAAVLARFLYRMGRRAIDVMFTEIAVTNRRFMEKSGVLSVNFFSTDLEKIVRVAIEQSPLGRIFNYGKVTIVTIGEVSHTSKDVAAPIALQQALHRRMTDEHRPKRSSGENGDVVERPGAA